MRISDWSSDVCSSDLHPDDPDADGREYRGHHERYHRPNPRHHRGAGSGPRRQAEAMTTRQTDRKSVVSGKSVSVRVDLGGRRIIKKKHSTNKPDPLLAQTTTTLQTARRQQQQP